MASICRKKHPLPHLESPHLSLREQREDTPRITRLSGPGAYVLVVCDPNAFFLCYSNVDLEIVYGPYGGALANGGELDDLGQPVRQQASGTLDIETLDRVAYGDGTSGKGGDDWPAEADGHGASLYRVLTAPYGNSSESWFAGPPTPGF